MFNEFRTYTPRVIGAAVLMFSAGFALPAAATPADVPTGACIGDEGVTVVVDFTDVGGEVDVACAPGAPENGRDALEGAGFVPEDSMPGMICAIDAHPDPCPEEFDGNFWSYWSGDGEDWETYEVGADDAEPAPGDVEGWRYFDGSEGPTLAPGVVLQAAQEGADGGDSGDEDAPEETPTEEGATEDDGAEGGADETTGDEAAGDGEDTDDENADDEAADDDEADSGASTGVWFAVAGIAILAAIAALVINRRKQQMD